jgi:hypothetical protein
VTETVALLNLVLGVAYVLMGTIALYELAAGWRDFGFSRFGAGLVAIAFTCGPHHLTHAVHVGIEGHPVHGLDLLTILVGLPPGLAWLALRIEALGGGRGDRFVAGTPGWLQALPTAAGAYLALVVVAALGAVGTNISFSPVALLGAVTAAVYFSIAWVMGRTQVRNRFAVGGWSLSGLMIASTFATCGVMHLALALQQLGGGRHADVHLLGVDAAAAAAGVYLLTVVRRLTRDLLDDWNTVGTSPVPA